MHISYPTPEPVATPRAREGLRAVVPTIFPPSTVNRGESVRVQPSELCTRELRLPPLQTGPDGLHFPKKRGPKPKLRFKDSHRSPVASQLSRAGVEKRGSHMPHRHDQHREGEELRLVRVSHRHPENHGHSQKHHRHHHHHHHHYHSPSCSVSSGASHRRFYPDRSLHPHRRDAETHRTQDGCSYTAAPLLKQQNANPSRPTDLPLLDKPYLLDKPSPSPLNLDLDEVTWRPCLSSVEKVLVTDVTSNFLTVTIKESSTSQGFFKAKR